MRNPDHPRLTRTVALLVLVAGATCSRAQAGDRPEHPERLDGTWTMELRLERSATLARETADVPPVRGTLVLLESNEAKRRSGGSGAPTHYGVYAADLRPLGLRGVGRVPVVAARLVGGDSVEIAFRPGHGQALVSRGALHGDSVAGHWWAGGTRTVPRSSGRFTLRRP